LDVREAKAPNSAGATHAHAEAHFLSLVADADCSERKVLPAGWLWLVCSERKGTVAADKPSEQARRTQDFPAHVWHDELLACCWPFLFLLDGQYIYAVTEQGATVSGGSSSSIVKRLKVSRSTSD
jgi:hypothetical protein